LVDRSGFTTKALLRDIAQVAVLALAIYLVASFTVQTVHVVGFSMTPTLQNNDLLVASKLDYRLHPPERGDIVILKNPGLSTEDYIKRVIGLPGEHVLIRDARVFVNGRPLVEPYLNQPWTLTPDWPVNPSDPQGETVPRASYFVLGDNRDHSSDSRYFGYISLSQIEGKAVLRFWPPSTVQLLNAKPSFG
jgi:signal peptidase I